MRRLSLGLLALGVAGPLAAVPLVAGSIGPAAAAESPVDRLQRSVQAQPSGDVAVRPRGRAIPSRTGAAHLPPQMTYSVLAPNGTAVVRINPQDGQVRSVAAAGRTGPVLSAEAWSASLSRIFYSATRERLASSVDSVPQAGGPAVREAVAEAGADVSRDGRRIVFAREEGATTNIFIADRGGANARRLTGAGGLAPRFSQDGSRIVFSRLLGSGDAVQADLFTIRADGTGLARVTGRTDTDDLLAAFSPDGRRLLFTRLVEAGDDLDVAVYSVGVDGRGLRLVRPDAAAPDWSANGWLTYLSVQGDGATQVLVRAPGLSSRDMQLTRETSVVTAVRFAR